MKEERFEVVLINDQQEFDAHEAKDVCWIDFCSPSGCDDECGVDFSG